MFKSQQTGSAGASTKFTIRDRQRPVGSRTVPQKQCRAFARQMPETIGTKGRAGRLEWNTRSTSTPPYRRSNRRGPADPQRSETRTRLQATPRSLCGAPFVAALHRRHAELLGNKRANSDRSRYLPQDFPSRVRNPSRTQASRVLVLHRKIDEPGQNVFCIYGHLDSAWLFSTSGNDTPMINDECAAQC
jgi:hypothetical protein